MNLEPAKHEKVVIYKVNLRISNVCRIVRVAEQRNNSQVFIKDYEFGIKKVIRRKLK